MLENKTVELNSLYIENSYEESRSLNQQLTFESADAYFANTSIPFGEA